MREKSKILIPMDGSAGGDTVLVTLLPFIRSRQAEVTIFHVAEAQEKADGLLGHLERHQAGLEKQGIPARVVLASGKPAEEILRYAAIGDFDLIAMTTHGRLGMERVLLGSLAEEVVRCSPVPTLLCRSSTRTGGWERIVVALDGTPGSEEILGDVVGLAKSLGAAIHLVQVGLSLLRSDIYRGVPVHLSDGPRTAYLDGIAARLIAEGVPAVAEHREGMAGTEIPLLARELDAGLICMTTEGRPEGLPGMDRSVAADVLRTAPCPVYIRRMTHVAGAKG